LIQAAGLELDIAKWVGDQGEIFLLQGISNDDHVSCKFLVPAWVRAFETRPQDAYAMLSAPLSAALKRCPSELDESVSRALRSTSMRVFVMAAIDPYGGILARMPLTCREAGAVGQSDAPMLTRERGMTAFRHGCLHSK
jgi:hypothetical protein